MLISFTIEAVVWVALIEFIGCFTTKFQVWNSLSILSDSWYISVHGCMQFTIRHCLCVSVTWRIVQCTQRGMSANGAASWYCRCKPHCTENYNHL